MTHNLQSQLLGGCSRSSISFKVRLDHVVNSRSAWVISVSGNETHIKERKNKSTARHGRHSSTGAEGSWCGERYSSARPYGPQDGDAELKVRRPGEVRCLSDSKYGDDHWENNIDKLLSAKIKISAHGKTRQWWYMGIMCNVHLRTRAFVSFWIFLSQVSLSAQIAWELTM